VQAGGQPFGYELFVNRATLQLVVALGAQLSFIVYSTSEAVRAERPWPRRDAGGRLDAHSLRPPAPPLPSTQRRQRERGQARTGTPGGYSSARTPAAERR
jgi:hypothetical protein